MYVGIRVAAVTVLCSLCVGAGVDARTVRSVQSVAPIAATRAEKNSEFSLASFSDILTLAAPKRDGARQLDVETAGVSNSDDVIIGTAFKLPATSSNAPQTRAVLKSDAATVPAVPLADTPGDPTAEPRADALPTNFPNGRAAFGSVAYFAQFAFAVLHVVALPITVPAQILFSLSFDGVPRLIAAAVLDLVEFVKQIPNPWAKPADTESGLSRQASPGATKTDVAPGNPEHAKHEAGDPTSKTEHEGLELSKTQPEVLKDPAKAPESLKPEAVPPVTQSVPAKPEPLNSEINPTAAQPEPVKPEPAKPESKPEPVKSEIKPEPVKPEPASSSVKVVRDSLKSTPGETTTTGGITKTPEGSPEGSKGAETDSKTPADTKVHDGVKQTVGSKSDKSANKPSTEKSSTEKSGSPSEGSSHSPESKAHSASKD